MRLFYYVATTMFLFFASPPNGSDLIQQENPLLKKVLDKLNKVKDYQAEGNLKTDIPFIKVPVSPVTIYYKSPDKYRIKKEKGISIVPKGGMNLNINSLLASSYSVVPGGAVSMNGQTLSVIRLLPSDESTEVVLTTLYINEKEALINRITTTTRDNGTYDMLLYYGKYAEWGLPDKIEFSFTIKDYKLPKGVTLEYEPENIPQSVDPPKNQKGKITIDYTVYTINKGVPDNIFR